MKNKMLIILLLITGFCESQSVINSSKLEYQKAIKSNNFVKDKNVKVYKDRLVLGKNYALKNNYSDEDFFEYKYLGSFGDSYKYIVIEKEDYNGSVFFVINRDKNFLKYEIPGKPYLFEDFVVTVNIESTTDNKNILCFFKTNEAQKVFKKINLPEGIIVQEIRLLDCNIYINDINNKFWKIKIK
ncbi:hypothetical protein CLU81_3696 [Flavobacterium sp. 9]|uniref:hypothetical protein n=1 Tax=Flavobacterium sp. 9 TaxID=2035198 RepID=UPI000C175AC3|nr:hypothetical protein [Flavobacterium sp. 9]PIF33121.1 hypothetical protein CLU81_3696 [Flavobacterium sp. 9]